MKEVDNKLINIDIGVDIYKHKVISLLQNLSLEFNRIDIDTIKVKLLIKQIYKDINEFNNLFNKN